jgi:hypothetical protein
MGQLISYPSANHYYSVMNFGLVLTITNDCKIQYSNWVMHSYGEALHCASYWKFDHTYKIMQPRFQVAFREAHHLAGEVVVLAEKQNVDMPILTLQQLKSIRYDNFIT